MRGIISQMTTPRAALFVAALLLSGCARPAFKPLPAAGTTTVIVVRHAEKGTDDPRDPSLTEAGNERALALRDALKDAGISAIYSTQFRRTRQTVAPLAQQLGLSIIERPVNSANAATHPADLAREVLLTHAGEAVLIVGHSNTVPQIVQALTGFPVNPIADSEYDHIFMVVIPAAGRPSLVNVRFGNSSR
jgi:broad specificity phosphatase PhoE